MSSSSSSPFELETELKRDLGVVSATTIIIGGIIGSGIFGAPAGIAQQLGNPGLFMLVWIIGGVMGFAGALCFAELGAMMPRSGGQYVYLKEAYPPIVAFLYGWMEVVLIQSAGLAAIAVVCTNYMGYFMPFVSSNNAVLSIGPVIVSTQQIAIWILMIFLCIVNYAGVRFGGQIMNLTTFAKVGALIGLALIAMIEGGGDSSHFTPVVPPDMDMSIFTMMGPAMIGALFAYQGWTNTNSIAGEVKDPQRVLPRAIFFGLGLCTVVYMLVNWSYLYVLSIDEIAASTRVAADVAERLMGPIGGSLISAAVMISTFGTMNGIMMFTPRIPYAMARDGLFFKSFTHVHPKYQTPSKAIIATTIWGMVWTFLGDFQDIINAFVYAVYAYYGLNVLALILLRRKYPDAHRPYKVPFYPYVPIFFLIIVTWVVISIITQNIGQALPGLGCLAVGAVVYMIWFRKK
jgi:APA family basic amino acid/polyamine antiporter